MKSGNSSSLMTVFVALILLVAAFLCASSVANSFGKGFAQGGGEISLFSDDITATNFGDGVTVAAKDSEVEVTNTVEKPEWSEEKLMSIWITVVLGMILIIFIAWLVT